MRVVVGLVVVFLLASCEDCVGPVSGADAGVGEGEGEEGEGDGGEGEEGEGEPLCGPDTPGFGAACSADGGLEQCDQFICNAAGDQLVCAGPGPNACGVCDVDIDGDGVVDPLDDSQGQPDAACGEFLCGQARCNAGGTATVCVGDHERNSCGGCGTLVPEDAVPGEVCSVCQTGERVCSTDDNEIFCVRGRSPDNRCGGCDRCIIAHAFLSDGIFGGNFVGAGTLALIEDVGGTGARVQLVFDPLVGGPGLDGLPFANVTLSNDPTQVFGGLELEPTFASANGLRLSDPNRPYFVPDNFNVTDFDYVTISNVDGLFFSDGAVAFGRIIPGPPPPPLVGPSEGEGEGEVVVGEGEGDVVVGEGEGDVVVGEGEGDVVVGEGEGDVVVVGEGEGE